MLKFISILAVLAGAVATTANGEDQSLGDVGIEPLLGLSLEASAVAFHVFTGGCSNPADFELQVLESDPPQLLLVRNEGDYCEAFIPEGKTLTYDLHAYGLDGFPRIRVANPFYNGGD